MANNKRFPISRRTVLKGAGAVIALPFLEAMLPRKIMASTLPKNPKYFIVCTVPNGILMENWTPKKSKLTDSLPAILSPLSALKNNVTVISNVDHVPDVADRWDGNGSAHAFSASSFLTGSTLNTVSGVELSAGISIDQVVAGQNNSATRVASLELGCDPSDLSQPCISFSPVYPQTISWANATTPNPKEIDPNLVFQRLFSVSPEQRQEKLSILDTIKDSATDLSKRAGLSVRDQQRLADYMDSIRDIENSLNGLQQSQKDFSDQAMDFGGGNKNYPQQLALMFKLMALALKTKTTNVITFVMAQEISTRTYEFIDVTEDHHDLSHYRTDKGKDYVKNALTKINTFHVQTFANFLAELKSEQEADGTLLDNSLILYGGGMCDGDAHGLKNLPLLLAGGANSTNIPWGTHLTVPDGNSMSNLHLSVLQTLGIGASTFAGVTTPLPGLG